MHAVVGDQLAEMSLYDGEVQMILAVSWIEDMATFSRESSPSIWVMASRWPFVRPYARGERGVFGYRNVLDQQAEQPLGKPVSETELLPGTSPTLTKPAKPETAPPRSAGLLDSATAPTGLPPLCRAESKSRKTSSHP